jgi:hypothetical protein
VSTENAIGNTQINFILNGLVNAAPVTLQSPTISIPQLPFGPWGTIATPPTVSGQVTGVPNPDQYQVGLFAVQDTGTGDSYNYLGGPSWLASVAADGSFSLSVPQSAGSYTALLLDPAFASQYYANTFPGGDATIHSLPSPTDHPGQVWMEVLIPAALGRYLSVFGASSAIPPQGALVYPVQRNFNSQNLPPGTLDPTVSTNYPQLWQELQGSPSSFLINALNSQQKSTGGSLMLSLYIFQNQLFLLVGAKGPATSPQFVSTVLVNWQAFQPSMVQVGLAVSVLPASLQLVIDQLNVEPSAVAELLEALAEVTKEFIDALFELLLE